MKKHIVCFGDSNTHGYQAENNGRFSEEERWTCLLNKYLGDEYLVLEEGMSGRTTVFEDPLFEGLSGLSVLFSCLMTHEPVDLLIIMLGTNDTKERFGANAQNIAKGMERLAAKALSASDAWRDAPNILIVSPPPIEAGYEDTPVAGEMGRGCAEKAKQLAFFYKETASRLGCHFFNAATIPGIKMNSIDCMHLDRESHERLARALAEIVPGIL